MGQYGTWPTPEEIPAGMIQVGWRCPDGCFLERDHPDIRPCDDEGGVIGPNHHNTGWYPVFATLPE